MEFPVSEPIVQLIPFKLQPRVLLRYLQHRNIGRIGHKRKTAIRGVRRPIVRSESSVSFATCRPPLARARALARACALARARALACARALARARRAPGLRRWSRPASVLPTTSRSTRWAHQAGDTCARLHHGRTPNRRRPTVASATRPETWEASAGTPSATASALASAPQPSPDAKAARVSREAAVAERATAHPQPCDGSREALLPRATKAPPVP